MTQANERSATLSQMVAEEIRALMARRRVSGRQLANQLGVSPSWISYRLTGTQPIDVNDLHRIATALGVSVHDLLPDRETAAGASVTAMYTGPARSVSRKRTRPRDNRPGGHPSPDATIGVRRTALLPRPTRRKAA